MIYSLDGIAPVIGPGAWVAPDANVIGAVTLAEEASVWFGAVLRGDGEPIAVGARSNVQEACILHTDLGYPLTVGADCTIGHKAILHGCTIEDGSLVGMGATVLNGAVIGAGSLVGAGALVTEGKAIPPGSLVMGAPGRVVRELNADARGRLIASAAHYVANARRFREGLRAV
jgi:carbonic anhydrase/acetyltransferase-like protein (isoleucine patch superfamily)